MEPDDNRLYKLSWQDIETLMERRFASFRLFATTEDDYHIVRFSDDDGESVYSSDYSSEDDSSKPRLLQN